MPPAEKHTCKTAFLLDYKKQKRINGSNKYAFWKVKCSLSINMVCLEI